MRYLLLIIALTGCAGVITESSSAFDGSRELSMKPAFVYRSAGGFSGSDIQMSLFWSSKMPNGKLLLDVYVNGIHSFAPGESLHFNIDGTIENFASAETFTSATFSPGSFRYNVPTQGSSSKRYVISTALLDKILTAKSVTVRVDMSREYVEGEFSDTAFSSAKNAFIDFREKLPAT